MVHLLAHVFPFLNESNQASSNLCHVFPWLNQTTANNLVPDITSLESSDIKKNDHLVDDVATNDKRKKPKHKVIRQKWRPLSPAAEDRNSKSQAWHDYAKATAAKYDADQLKAREQDTSGSNRSIFQPDIEETFDRIEAGEIGERTIVETVVQNHKGYQIVLPAPMSSSDKSKAQINISQVTSETPMLAAQIDSAPEDYQRPAPISEQNPGYHTTVNGATRQSPIMNHAFYHSPVKDVRDLDGGVSLASNPRRDNDSLRGSHNERGWGWYHQRDSRQRKSSENVNSVWTPVTNTSENRSFDAKQRIIFDRQQSSQRGRGRARASNGRGSQSRFFDRDDARLKKQQERRDSDMARPTGDLVEEMDLRSITTQSSDMHIAGWTYMASFDWLNSSEPTILVPGQPPMFSLMPSITCLEEDTGTAYRDPNAASFAKHTNEATITALLEMQPGLDSSSIDVVTCDESIKMLMGTLSSHRYRMHVEVVGNTVFLVRREPSPTQPIDDLRGYGQGFLDACTTKNIKDSTSHHRVVQYTFGELRVLLRSRIKGYYAHLTDGQDTHQASTEDTTTAASAPTHSVQTETNRLQASGKQVFSNDAQIPPISPETELKLDEPITKRPEVMTPSSVSSSDSSGVKLSIGIAPTMTLQNSLIVLHGGCEVSQASLVEVKTRSVMIPGNNREDEAVSFGQWVKRVPNYVLAQHSRGVFDDIHATNVMKKMEHYEKRNNFALSRLNALMSWIVKASRAAGVKAFELICETSGKVELRMRNSEEADVRSLSTMLAAKFEQAGREAIA